MSKNALQILANILASTTVSVIETTTPESAMLENYSTPFPANWLAENETSAVLTVTRKGQVVHYLTCTTGARFIDVPFPMNDGSRNVREVRNVRDWDYAVRTLALNGFLQVGDLVEVTSNGGYYAVARFVMTEVDVAPSWSRDGVRQPVEAVLVTVRGNSCLYHNDGGYYCCQAWGSTHPVTGLVEQDLSRW